VIISLGLNPHWVRSGHFVTVMCKRFVNVLRSVAYIFSSLKFAVTVMHIFNLERGGFCPGVG